ncbi:MAG: extracellular solute-binding protein [Acutalibacter sp.]
MMKRALKTLLCGLMASLLLAGCTQTGGSSGSNSSSTESAPESTVSQTSEAAEGETTYDENGVSPEGTFPIVEEPITLTVMFPSQTAIPDIAENSFTKEYEELTGIHIEWQEVPSDSLADRVNISLSSGDMPDIYLSCGVSLSQQQAYGPQGAFVPLNDYIEQYGEVFQKIEENVPGVADTLTMGDGNIYALPYIEKCVHCEGSSKLWINTKWLDALDMEPPTTVDEFEDMLRRFKEEDPNGNGEADEIPLLTYEGGWHSNAMSGWLTNPFVYTSPDNNYVYLDGDEIKLSYMQDGWKEAMSWLNKLYEEGLYYDQSLVINYDQARQLCAADGTTEDVGCFTGGTPDLPGADVSQWGPYVALAPIEGPNGRVATWMPYSQITPTAFVITSACENPAAAFRWGVEQYNKDINYRKTFGVEGENWKYVTPGEDDVPADAADFNTGDPAEIAPFIDGVGWGDEQDYCWRGLGLRCDTGDYKDLRYAQVQSGDYDTNMEHRLSVDTQEQMEPYYPDMEICVPTLVYTEEQSATLANTESVVISYVEEMAAAFITGTSDPEADWDAYLNELSVKGVDQLLEIYQAGYDARS